MSSGGLIMPGKYKLVAFDVDGTLIDEMQFVWVKIHQDLGMDPEKVGQARDDFLNGRITFREWADYDTNLWIRNGVTKHMIEKSVVKFSVMEGAIDTIKELHRRGYKLAIISGGLDIVIDHFLSEVKKYFSHVVINRLKFDDGGNLTGIEIPPEYEGWGENKQIVLKTIADKEGISTEDCVFVGDSNNDMDVIKEAGLGIAFNATPELSEAADIVIKKKDLREILKIID